MRDGIMLFAKAKEKEQKKISEKQEDRLFIYWAVSTPHMGENFISFEDYKKSLIKSNTSNDVNINIETNKTTEEIKQDALNILKMDIGKANPLN